MLINPRHSTRLRRMGQASPIHSIAVRLAHHTSNGSYLTLYLTFVATAVQVFGTRNATHGVYRATLSASNSSQPLSSQTYNASAPCDFPGAGAQNVLPGCEWRGSVLKFSAANLDPALSYQLRLENIDTTNKVFGVCISSGGFLSNRILTFRCLDVDLIRTFDAYGPFPLPGFTDDGSGSSSTGSGSSNNNGTAGSSNSGNGALGRAGGIPAVGEMTLFLMAWLFLWRSLFGRL